MIVASSKKSFSVVTVTEGLDKDSGFSTPKNILDNNGVNNSNIDVDNLLTSSPGTQDLLDNDGPSADSPQTEANDLTKPGFTNGSNSEYQIKVDSNKISTSDKTSIETQTTLTKTEDNFNEPEENINKNSVNDPASSKENVPNNLTSKPHILTDTSKPDDKVNALLDNKGPNETNDTESENVTKDPGLLGDKPNDEQTASNEEFQDKNENKINKNSLLSDKSENAENEIIEDSKVDIEAATNPSNNVENNTENAPGALVNEKHNSDIEPTTILSTIQDSDRNSDKPIKDLVETLEGGFVNISENKATLGPSNSKNEDDVLGKKPLEITDSMVDQKDSSNTSIEKEATSKPQQIDDETEILFIQEYDEIYNDDVDDDYNNIDEEIVDTKTKKFSTTTLRSIISTSKPFNLETTTAGRLPAKQPGSKQNIIDTLAKLFVKTLGLTIRIKNAIDANAVDNSENVLQIISRKDPEITGQTNLKVPTLIKVILVCKVTQFVEYFFIGQKKFLTLTYWGFHKKRYLSYLCALGIDG